MNPSEQSATRSRRKRRQNSCSGDSAATPPWEAGTGSRRAPCPRHRIRGGPDPPHSSAAPVLILSTLPHWRDPIANTWQTRALSVRHGLFDNLPTPGTDKCRARDTGRMDTLFESDAAAPDPDPGQGAGQGPAGNDDRPLAARMRPGTLADFVGQTHLLGDGSALRTAIEQGHPHSMILYGPPGTGKTTLARMVAEHANAVFEELSAVQAGRAEVRAVLERAAHRRAIGGTADRVLPRRDPPLQQGPAGRSAAGGRGWARSR